MLESLCLDLQKLSFLLSRAGGWIFKDSSDWTKSLTLWLLYDLNVSSYYSVNFYLIYLNFFSLQAYFVEFFVSKFGKLFLQLVIISLQAWNLISNSFTLL